MAFTATVGLTDLPRIYNIHFPVGPGLTNDPDDVRLVQALMKMANFTRFTPALGPVEASRNIKVDGIFGPQTQRMITAFEVDRLAARPKVLLIADGFFERAVDGGFTKSGVLFKIVHLNRSARNSDKNAYDQFPFDEATHPALRRALAKGAVKPPPSPQPGTR
jgi:peptidoglycan hydrolase-like protein with peptidoglycan-binding domain